VALVNIVRLAEALEIAPADLLKGLDPAGSREAPLGGPDAPETRLAAEP
jgi:hypothetical protein